MNRCPSCGTTYPDDARFCTRDGTRLVGSAESASAMKGTAAPGTTPPRPTEPPVRRVATGPASEASLVGKTLEGRYEILKKVGEGGMSFVYLARDIANDVAVPCSDRHAYPDLACPPRDRERDHGIEADARQNEPERADRTE